MLGRTLAQDPDGPLFKNSYLSCSEQEDHDTFLVVNTGNIRHAACYGWKLQTCRMLPTVNYPLRIKYQVFFHVLVLVCARKNCLQHDQSLSLGQILIKHSLSKIVMRSK